MIRHLLGVLFLSTLTAAQNRTRCFECRDVPFPSVCEQVTTCAIGYKCSVEKIVTSGGLVLYNSGCQLGTTCSANRKRGVPQDTMVRSLSSSSDNVTCSECCDGEFCNNAGCGQTAPARSQRGPLCFRCEFENNPQNCRRVGQCEAGTCMIQQLRQTSPSGQTLFTSKCVHDTVCKAYAIIGKKRAAPYCHVCCQEDFCNERCPTTTTS